MTQKVIGVCGKRGHGKDYFANFLKEQDNSYEIVHFADRLKELSAVIFGHDVSDYHTQEGKARLYSSPLVMDDYLSAMRVFTKLPIEACNKLAHSHREVLQYFGTEYVRNASATYWVDYIKSTIKANPDKNYIIPDTRFPNEIMIIKSLGGFNVMVKRPDLEGGSDTHASEDTSTIEPLVDIRFETVKGDNRSMFYVAGLLKNLSTEGPFADEFKHLSDGLLVEYSPNRGFDVSLHDRFDV